MHTFTDNAGRVWTANLNVATLKRVRALAGVDLASAILVERDGRVEASLLERLASDPALLVDALYALCKDEADKLKVTDEDFGRAMAGDAILGATDALLDEIVDFFPNPKRAILQRLVAAARRAETAAKAALDKALSTDELDKAVDSLLAGSTGSSTNSPASAG